MPEGAHIVFSAHGVSPAVVNAAADRGLHAIDATCPLVTKVHREAVRFARDDYEILLIGHEGHEEVEGTAGEAPDHVTLVSSPDDVPNIEVRDPDKVVWLSQTTLCVDETMETVRRLRERFPNLQDPPSDDICYATQNRQVAIKKVAQDADLVIVVGSANSSNSVRLVEVALEYGAKAAYRVDYASEVKQEWLDGVETVGVTSGASVPEELVQELLVALADAGYGDVAEVKTAEEDLMFSLPEGAAQGPRGQPRRAGARRSQPRAQPEHGSVAAPQRGGVRARRPSMDRVPTIAGWNPQHGDRARGVRPQAPHQVGSSRAARSTRRRRRARWPCRRSSDRRDGAGGDRQPARGDGARA